MADLWAGIRIPIIMVSGPVNSGKTLFGLTIDPNCRRPATEVAPTTICWDQEGSADPYESGLNFLHKDTRQAVAAGVHMQVVAAGPNDPRWRKILLENADVNDSPTASLFRAWYFSLLNTEAGKYAVGMCDTFTPLQAGLIDWLRKHPLAFGRSVAEYDKFAQATLWPDVKEVLAYILATDCRLRFDTFVITSHMKNEWVNKQPTGRKISEGLDTMEKLATRHIELDRTAADKAKDAPRLPSALVKKERLVRFGATSDSDQPILPPRIPACSPDAIRRYIAIPPDFSKLKAEERVPDQSMSDDDKLRLQASIAADQRAAEETKLSALEMARQAAAAGRYPVANAADTTIEPPPAAVATPARDPLTSPLTQTQATEIMGLLRALFATGASAQAWLAQEHQCLNPARLTETQATGVLSGLYEIKADRMAAANVSPVVQPTAATSTAAEFATSDQRNQIRELTMAVFGDRAAEAHTAFLATCNVQTAASLTFPQAQQRILQLESLRKAPLPENGDDIPF